MKRRMGRGKVVCVSALLLAVSWPGKIEAVECVSKDLSLSCHRTIQEALAAADPGEEIAVNPGIYAENVSVDTAGVRVVGQGVRPGQVVITPGGGVVVALNAPQTGLKNVTVWGGGTGVVINGAGAVLEGVVVKASENGISVASEGVRVRNCTIRQIDGRGIEAEGAHFSLTSSSLHHIGGQCVEVSGDGALVEKNQILDCGGGGVKISGSSASILENDVLVAGGNLVQVDGSDPRIRRNMVQGGWRGAAIVVSADSPIVTDNEARDCETGIDVYCGSCGGALLAGNVASDIYDCPGFSVIAGSPGIVVRGNTSRRNSDDGFFLQGPGMVVRDNKAYHNGLDGLRVLSPSPDARLTDNRSNANVRNGIRIEGGVAGIILKRNRAHGNGDVDFYDAGTGTILGSGPNRNSFGTVGGP